MGFDKLRALVRPSEQGLFDELTRPKKNKFNNVKVTSQTGEVFDSRLEYGRYRVLEVLALAGEIRCLRTQVPFVMHVNGQRICKYIADFEYLDCKTGEIVVEDAKGVRTASYMLKRKLMKALYGIIIKETGSRTTAKKGRRGKAKK